MSNDSNRDNTLRLGQHELHKMLEEFDKAQGDSKKSPDREFVRWAFRVGSVDLTVFHSSGNKVTLPVATRNISKGGICILHSAFIHTGTTCEVTLKLPGGKPLPIPGEIRRCTHVQGRVHEIGIAFEEQISTKDLLGLDPLNEAYSLEHVEPDHLHGTVLLVTPSDMDCQMLLIFLEETKLILSTANSVTDAVKRSQKGVDLVIADYHLAEETGPQLVEELRKQGIDVPVIIMTSDKTEKTLDAIRDAEAAGILSKPITKDRLLQAVAEFLHADGDGGPLYTELRESDPMHALVGKFLADITRVALNLEESLQENKTQECLKICRSLSGTSSPLGFPSLSELAIASERKLEAGDAKTARNEILSLIVACRRIKSKSAA